MKITPLQAWIENRISLSDNLFGRKQLETYQLERLQWVLTYVREQSPYYRNHLLDSPREIRSLSDLSALPFTTADDIRANPNRFVRVSQDEIQRIVTLPTSGTTGESKRIFFTSDDQELTIDFFKVGMSTLAKAGDRVLILLPGQRPGSVGDLLKTGLERLGCSALVYGPVDEEKKVLQVIKENKINLLVGAPVHLHRLARWDEAFKILPTHQIHSVLSSTDVLANTIRANLQSIWGCEVFDHWGMTETGLGGGVECDIHQGFHLREADLYLEIVDPETGKPLPEGETGEVVATTLTRRGMPLLRYRTGDLSRLISGECQCGSFIKRLDRITNRVGAGISLPSGLITQNDLDEVLFQIREVLDFSAQVKRNLGAFELTIHLNLLQGRNLDKIKKEVLKNVMESAYKATGLLNNSITINLKYGGKHPSPSSNSLPKRVIQNL